MTIEKLYEKLQFKENSVGRMLIGEFLAEKAQEIDRGWKNRIKKLAGDMLWEGRTLKRKKPDQRAVGYNQKRQEILNFLKDL